MSKLATLHNLKTIEPYFTDIWNDRKAFELRDNTDREFAVGDYLLLKQYDKEFGYSGLQILTEITYILKDASAFGLDDKHAILQIRIIEKNKRIVHIVEEQSK